MLEPPGELLERWIEHVPLGHALDIGAGEGDAALWLAEKGFRVDAIESDESASAHLRDASKDWQIVPHLLNVLDYVFPIGEYQLILASAVLHFIKPTDLWPLADRMVAALAPGGFLIAESLTTDDPGYDALQDWGARQIEPNTFLLPSWEAVIHYFSPGELLRTFAALEMLHYEESRRRDVQDPVGFRAGASLVAWRGK